MIYIADAKFTAGAMHQTYFRILFLIIISSFIHGQTYYPLNYSFNSYSSTHNFSTGSADSLISGILSRINTDSIRANMQGLQDFGTRHCMAQNRDSVARWIKRRFEYMGYTDVKLDSFIYKGTWQQNVEATLNAEANEGPVIIIGAHHDSFSMKDSLNYAPGADDNASGTAAVLELARVLRASGYKPKATLKFVTFAAEEVGLLGSKHYAQTSRDKDQNIRLMINLDMISNSPFAPASSSVDVKVSFPFYKSIIENVLLPFTDLKIKFLTRGGSSDHMSFDDNGYKTIYFSETVFSPYYHSAKDLVSNHNIPYCAEVTRLCGAVLLRIDQTPEEVRDIRIYDKGTGSSLYITWNSDVINHKIYVGTTQGNYDTVYNATGTNFNVEGLDSGVKYFIGISAYNPLGIEGQIIEVSSTPTVIPALPAEFTDMPLKDRINLSWRKNIELDITGYNIYRSQSISGTAVKLNEALITDTLYSDEDVESGLYYYYQVRAVDNTGLESSPASTRSRMVSLDSGVLLVEEFLNDDGSFGSPVDSAYAKFFNKILKRFANSNISLSSDKIKLADMGAYSTIIWSACDNKYTSVLSERQDDLRKYLESGGNIIFNGYFPGEALSGYTLKSAQLQPGSLLYDYFGVAGYERETAPRFFGAKTNSGDYQSIFIDTTKTTMNTNYHLTNIEAINASPSGKNIFTFESRYGTFTTEGYFNGKVVGIENVRDTGKTIILTFPLYYMKEGQAKDFIESALIKFEEELLPDEDPDIPEAFQLVQNYPNPFNAHTTIIYDLPAASEISLVVYDILGKQAAVVETGFKNAGRHITGFNGTNLASGVYYYQLNSASGVATKKMMLVK